MAITQNIQKIPVEAILNTVLDGLITISNRGIIMSFNPAAERIFQYQADEVVGQNIKMLMPEPYHSGHDQYLANYLTSGDKKVIGIGREVSAQRKDGSVFPMELGVNEMAIEGERMFIGTIRDITERKRLEQELKGKESHFRMMVENVKDYATVTLDKTGHIVTWNMGAERLKGYQEAEIVGQHFSSFYLQEAVAQGKPEILLSQASQDGHVEDEDWRVKKDGTRFMAHVSINALYGENGVVEGFVKVTRDITERKKNEDLMLAEANRLQAVMNTVLDGLITIDNHGIIASFNPAAVRIFQYAADEVVGKNVKVLMPDPYHSEHDGYLHNYLTSGDKKVIGIGREVSARRKDGSIFPMELGVNEMDIGGARMFVGTIRDITSRREAEASIELYLAQLKRSNEELDEFAYIASHDLKEPLRGLSNNAEFLDEDYGEILGDDGKKRLTRIKFLANRLENLVDNLLYFSRLGRQELAIQDVDLNSVIKDIEHLIEGSLVQANAQIRVPKPLPRIVCDVPRITEVFRNLITNSLKYNDKPEKWIEVGVIDVPVLGSAANKERAFYVKDNGIGIAEQFYNDVFRIFKRLNSESDDTKGTGVGLTFVKKIIERHKGRIWLESVLGEGTTFFFTLKAEDNIDG